MSNLVGHWVQHVLSIGTKPKIGKAIAKVVHNGVEYLAVVWETEQQPILVTSNALIAYERPIREGDAIKLHSRSDMTPLKVIHVFNSDEHGELVVGLNYRKFSASVFKVSEVEILGKYSEL